MKIIAKNARFFSDFGRFFMDLVTRSVKKSIFFMDFRWENPLFSPIFHVGKSFFCCIFTRFGRIKKINADLNSPFDGECGQLTQPGVWLLYCGLFFYYRSNRKSIPRKWHSEVCDRNTRNGPCRSPVPSPLHPHQTAS